MLPALNYLNISVMVFTLLCSLYRYRQLDGPTRILSVHLALAVIAECLGRYAAARHHSNTTIYSIFSIVEYTLLCVYFNYVIDTFRKWNVGLYLGGLGILIGALLLIFFQPLSQLNTCFLLFEGFTAVVLALICFRQLFKNDHILLHTCHHFWFPAIIAFYWIATFLNWGLYSHLVRLLGERIWMINVFIIVVNMICYLSGAAIFLMYPKMRSSYAR